MPESDIMPQTEAVAAARKIGEQNGKNAASWVFDGNTPIEVYQTTLHGIMNGDPAILNRYRTPELSGEYTSEYTEADLWDEIGIDGYNSEDTDLDEIAHAYLESASSAFWDELERIARGQLG